MRCYKCRKSTGHWEAITRNKLHLALSVLTGGTWLVVWLVVILVNANTAPKCLVCKTRFSKAKASKQIAAEKKLEMSLHAE